MCIKFPVYVLSFVLNVPLWNILNTGYCSLGLKAQIKLFKHFLFGLVWLGVMSCCIVLQAYEIIHEFHAPFPIQTKYGPCRLLIFLSADTSAFHTLVGYVMGNNCLEDHKKDTFTIFSVCLFFLSSRICWTFYF